MRTRLFLFVFLIFQGIGLEATAKNPRRNCFSSCFKRKKKEEAKVENSLNEREKLQRTTLKNLFKSTKREDILSVNALLQSGKLIGLRITNQKDSKGNTLLHIAAKKKNKDLLEIILLLCGGSIDFNTQNNKGKTALELTKKEDLREMILNVQEQGPSSLLK